MKKMIMTLLLAALALALCLPACAEETDKTAVETAPLMGLGTNLGNTFEACDANRGNTGAEPTRYETLWGQPVTTREMIHGMREAGFSTIRVPVAWMTNASHLSTGDYTLDQAYIDRVAEVVRWALDEGMYVILNDHWDGGWYGMFGSEFKETRDLAMEAYRGMWSQLAEYFKEEGDHLIFEGANEEIGARFDENSALYCNDSVNSYLTDDERYALANQVNQAFVDTVRAAGGKNATRFLLIPGYGTNIDQTCDSRFIMPKDSAKGKLFVSVHYYDPWSYCGENASAASATRWGTKKDLQSMSESLAKMDKFTKAGYGVIIGEYGALPAADGVSKENSALYHQSFLNLCTVHGFVSCLWDTSGFYVRRNLSFADPAMAEVYARFSAGRTKEEAQASFDAAVESAPATFSADAIQLTDEKAAAWIMWNDGGWAISYSVGDTYNPDAKTPGLKVTDVEITGEGTYTVGIDFTGTEQGYSAGVAFAALAIGNGEDLFPGYCIHIQECLINGEKYALKGRPYTTSDDGHCTRANLFNEWVTKVPRDKARVLYGDLTGVSPTLINRNDPVISHIESIYITFVYAPRK